MAFFVNAVVVLRSGVTKGNGAIVLLGAGLLVTAAAAVACGAWRRRSLMQPDLPIAPQTWLIRAGVIMTWAACAAGLASIWTSMESS